MKRKFRVLLPVEIDGQIYGFGSEIELSLEVAKDYSHALMAVAEDKKEEKSGSNT